MPAERKYHPVDGKMMSTDEIAAMLGITKQALWLRRSRLGRCSYQALVNMYRANQFGNARDKRHRYLIDGSWRTRDEIARMLGVDPHTISTWRCAHRQPDGSPAPMEDAIAYYRQYLTGERKRGGTAGGRPWRAYTVNGRTWTVKDVAEKYGVKRSTVHNYLQKHDHDMAQALAFYTDKARRRKAREARQARRAEKEIMRILGF